MFLGLLLVLILNKVLFLALASWLNISRTPSTYQCTKNKETGRRVRFILPFVLF